MIDKIVEEQKKYLNKIRKINNNKKLYYNILTMGCQLNENDSEKLAGMLEEMGYIRTEILEEASLYVINTCCVRENAEEKLFGKLGELKKLKKQNDSIIAIGGCMMQEKHIQDKLKQSYPYVDIIFGTHTLHKFEEDLKKVIEERKKVRDVIDIDGEVIEDLPIKRNDKFKASVTIMYGCNNFCSYCIVPYVRGRERSRDFAAIMAELCSLASSGIKEVMLLGQNVNSYGKTLEVPMNFAELLHEVNEIPGLQRIRFMTSHPKDLSEELIQAMAECDKVCTHLHLPLQSGSTEILKKMNRRYTKEDYLALVDRIRDRLPDISLTTDIIVGFPGETEEDFEETLDVLRKVRYDSVYSFIYSRRTGTPAAAMEDQVPEDVVKQRFDRLLTEIQAISREITDSKVGKIEEVLMEEINDHDPSLITGRLSSNAVVHCPASEDCIGEIRRVKLTESKGFYFMGEIQVD